MADRTLFVSSVQREFAGIRRALKDYVRGDPLLRRFFDVFLFEDLPARDQSAESAYLGEVDRCAVFVSLFGREYGSEDADGLSPVEREFARATERGKERLVFIRAPEAGARHPKLERLVRAAERQVVRREFTGVPDLAAALYASLVEYLEREGALTTRPFDASACPGATLADLSVPRLEQFVARARAERRLSPAVGGSTEEVLTHLGLLDGDQLTRAAVLLFASEPQRFLPSSEVKCMHFHGGTVQKPIPSYQVLRGTVFELVDQAVDFVLSKIARRVGTRAEGSVAPVTYELPREAVAEAIVNAVAHRDYASGASVQVMLFADRLEVVNPGELPAVLTPERLRLPHPSIPRNPLLADPLYLARYIEKAGTGTLDMIDRCRAAGLREPEFRQDGGSFVQAIPRPAAAEVTGEVTGEVAGEVPAEVARLLRAVQGERKRSELQEALGLRHEDHFREHYLKPALEAGLLEMTQPDRPRSSTQRYRLSAKGRRWRAAHPE